MRGMTIVEVLIVIVVFGILAAVISPSARTWRASRELESTTAYVLDVLTEARERTLQSKDAKQYGVEIESDAVVLFVGDTFSSSAGTNERTSFGSDIQLASSLSGGATAVVFSRLTGEASVGGTITVTHTTSGASRDIVIYETGVISEE